MKKLSKILLLVWILAACAPKPIEQPFFSNEDSGPRPSYPNPSYPNPSYPNPNDNLLSPVEDIVVKQLAGNLGVQVSDISVVSNEVIEFSDGCLGVSMPEVMCAQVITPGRIIVLEANGVQYEYHLSEDGSRIQPATLALTWSRDGGIAGFCDRLTVFLSGEVYGNTCKVTDGRMGTFVGLLSVSKQAQFNLWIAEYGQVDLDASDPKGVADGMTVLLSLQGNGKTQPSKDDNVELFTWAQDLYQELYK